MTAEWGSRSVDGRLTFDVSLCRFASRHNATKCSSTKYCTCAFRIMDRCSGALLRIPSRRYPVVNLATRSVRGASASPSLGCAPASQPVRQLLEGNHHEEPRQSRVLGEVDLGAHVQAD